MPQVIQMSRFERYTSIGMRRRVQDLKGIDEFRPRSDGVKQREHLLHNVLQPQVVGYIQTSNRGCYGTMHIHEDVDSHEKTTTTLTRIISRKEGISFIE